MSANYEGRNYGSDHRRRGPRGSQSGQQRGSRQRQGGNQGRGRDDGHHYAGPRAEQLGAPARTSSFESAVEVDGQRAGRQSPAAALLAAAREHLEGRDLPGVTKVLIKLAKVEYPRGGRNDQRLTEVLQQLHSQLLAPDQTILPRDLSDISFALGKLGLHEEVVRRLLTRIADLAKHQADKFTPHDIGGIVWGFASLGVRNESLMSVIAAEIVNKIEDFDQRQLSNTAWAFAKCGLWNEQLVGAIAQECLAKISTFTAQSLSHTCWAMAQWSTRKDDLMNAIAMEVCRKTSEFTPAPLAMTAWSFASLQIKNGPLMSAISSEAASKISSFKTQDVAHLAWAFANLRTQDQGLFNIMAEEIQSNIKGTHPPELANIAWAFSKNNFSHEPLMNTIASEATSQLRNFKPAEMAMLTWAFAIAGLPNKQLMQEIGAQVAKRMDKFTAPQLSHIVWSFGALSLRHSEFLQSLSARVHETLNGFNAQGLSNVAWAFAMVANRDETLLRGIAPEIARQASELRPLALARCAWAYHELAVYSPDLMKAITREALHKVDEFPTKALVKLIDSVYVSPAAAEHTKLEKELSERVAKLSTILKEAWEAWVPPGHGPAGGLDSYSSNLANFGCLDCGNTGTPMLLSQLQIELPGLVFIESCRSKEWTKSVQDDNGKTSSEYTVAELNLRVQENSLHAWVMQYARDGEKDADVRLPANPLLLAVDLPGRSGHADSTYLVLLEVCKRIGHMGVELDSQQACSAVEGSLQLLSTVLPGVSSVGALRQFAVRFPNVILEFAEQAGVAAEQ